MIGQDIMTAFPEALGPQDTIQKAAQLMWDHDCGIIPILDGLGALVGVITDRDIVIQAVAKGYGPETPSQKCMSLQPDTVPKDLHTFPKDLPLGQALHLMNTRQIWRLPAVRIPAPVQTCRSHREAVGMKPTAGKYRRPSGERGSKEGEIGQPRGRQYFPAVGFIPTAYSLLDKLHPPPVNSPHDRE